MSPTPAADPAAAAAPAEAALRSYVRRPLASALGFSLAINLALLAPSLFMLQVYDRVLVTRSIETLVMLALLALGALAVFGALDQVRARMLTLLGAAVERRFGPPILERMVIGHARQLPGASPDGLRDLSVLRAFLSGPAMVALFDAPWAVLYLGLIAAFDLRLGAVALAAVALLLFLTWRSDRLARQGFAELQDAQRAAGRLAERAVHNAEVVTALGMSGVITRRWGEQQARVQQASLDMNARTGRLNAFSRAARQGVQVLMLGVGAWLVIREGATPGVMIATTIILGRALAPVEQLIGGWHAFSEARLAHQRLQALLAQAGAGAGGLPLPRPAGHVLVEGLTYATPAPGEPGGRLLLRGVSFISSPGELVAVVGGSGAGKTTLARLLVGVLRPTAGTVRLDGADIRQHDPRALGRAIGYLPQDVELFAGTVAENIARFEAVGPEQVIAAAQAAGAHDLILRLPQGYDTPVGEGGRMLSGGQRQRVALARALLREPSYVVLDEPDASLDAEGENALVAALQRLRERGAAVIVVTQRQRMLSAADRVLVLRDGVVERTAVRRDPAAGGGAVGDLRGNTPPGSAAARPEGGA